MIQKRSESKFWGSKTLSVSLILALLVNQIFYGTAGFAAPASEAVKKLTPQTLTQWTLPQELGRVAYANQGGTRLNPRGPVVLLIEDAHAVPTAQESIRKIIDQLQTRHGLKTVFFEGAEGRLDPLLFRAFADKKNLQQVFNQYRDRGELSGVTLAAVLNPAESVYEGVETQALYEEQVNAWLEADLKRASVESRLKFLKTAFLEAETRHESLALHTLNEAERSFEESQNLENWLKTLNQTEAIAKIKKLEVRYPAVAAVFHEMKGTEDPAAQTAVRKALETAFTQLSSAEPSLSRELSEKRQDYLTERISAGAWGSELVSFARRNQLTAEFPAVLKDAVSHYRRLEKIQGHEFFEQLEALCSEIRAAMMLTAADKTLEQTRTRLKLLEKLVRLELTRKEWELFSASAISVNEPGTALPADLLELRQNVELFDHELSADASIFVRFYRLAEAREDVFWQKIQPALQRGILELAAFVGGGFHTDGLRAKLKQAQIAHAVITPAMTLNPAEKDFYRSAMRGKVSWGAGFDAQDTDLDPYTVFSRAAVSELSKKTEAYQIRLWQRAVRDSAFQKGAAAGLPEYLQLLSEGAESAEVPREFLNEWENKVDRFIGDLQQARLQAKPEVLSVRKMTATAPLANPVVRGVRYPKAWRQGRPAVSAALQRSEVRKPPSLLVGVHDYEGDPNDAKKRTYYPDWWVMQLLSQELLSQGIEKAPVALGQIKEAVMSRIKGLGFKGGRYSVDKMNQLLDRLTDEYGLLKRAGGGYSLQVEPQTLMIRVNDVGHIREMFSAAVANVRANKGGAAANLKALLSGFAKTIEKWDLYSVEAAWPILKAINTLPQDDRRVLTEFLALDANSDLLTVPLIDSIRFLLTNTAIKDWLKIFAPSLVDSAIYYISPETWLAAGGLGRVGQYHTLAAKLLMEGNAQMNTIEPQYSHRVKLSRNADGTWKETDEKSVDYEKIPVPVKNLQLWKEFDVYVSKNGKRTKVTVQVSRGVNEHGVQVYLYKDKPEQEGGDSFFTKVLYGYRNSKSEMFKDAVDRDEFTEFASKVSFIIARKIEFENVRDGKTKQPPSLWANDGQTALMPLFKLVSDDIEMMSPQERQRILTDPTHEYYDYRDLVQGADEVSFVEAVVLQTTHTYRNRVISGQQQLIDNLRLPRRYHGYLESGEWLYLNDFQYINAKDATSAGVRAAFADMGGANGVAALHSEEMNPLDEGVPLRANTNGDTRKATRSELENVFQMPDFKKLFPKEDSENPSAAALAEAKKRSKRNLKTNASLLALNPRFAELNEDQIVFGYTGRGVPEKVGLERAHTRENIREIVRRGGQVILLANAQPGNPESQEIYGMLHELENELFEERQAALARGEKFGLFLAVTGWQIPEQRLVLAGMDIQVNDSDRDAKRGTEAAGVTETDVMATGGLEMTSPFLEAIFQQQGVLLNWNVAGSGNTIIPESSNPEAYLAAMLHAMDVYKKDRLHFATFQVASIRLSQILEAYYNGAAYLLTLHQLRVQKNDLETLWKSYFAMLDNPRQAKAAWWKDAIRRRFDRIWHKLRAAEKSEQALAETPQETEEDLIRLLSVNDGGFQWKTADNAVAVESASGLLGLLQGFEQLRSMDNESGKGVYAAVKYHLTHSMAGDDGDIFRYVIGHLLKGNLPSLQKFKGRLEALRRRASNAERLDDKIKANLEALSLLQGLIDKRAEFLASTSFTGQLIRRYVGGDVALSRIFSNELVLNETANYLLNVAAPSEQEDFFESAAANLAKGDHFVANLFRSQVLREKFAEYLKSKTDSGDSLDFSSTKTPAYPVPGNERGVFIGVDLGDFIYSPQRGGEQKAWSSLRGVSRYLRNHALPGQTLSRRSQFQVRDVLTGAIYSQQDLETLESKGLAVGVPAGFVQVFAVESVPEERLPFLITNAVRGLLTHGRESSVMISEELELLSENPSRMREVMLSLSKLTAEQAAEKFKDPETASNAVPAVMALIGFFAPDLLENVKTWDPDVFQKLTAVYHKSGLGEVLQGGIIEVHRPDPDNAVVISKTLGRRKLVLPIAFSKFRFSETDGKVWVRLKSDDIGIIDDGGVFYNVRDYTIGAIGTDYGVHSGRELSENDWHVGIPVVPGKQDKKGITQHGWQFQLLELEQMQTARDARQQRIDELVGDKLDIPQIEGQVFFLNLTDLGGEMVDGQLIFRNGLKRADRLLQTLEDLGVGEIYLGGGLNPVSQTSEDLHQVPNAKRHFIQRGRSGISVHNYRTNRVEAGELVLKHDQGNPYSVGGSRGMLEINPRLALNEDARAVLQYFLQRVHERGIKARTDVIAWRSPDSIDETNYKQTFYRELTEQEQRIYSAKPAGEEQEAYLQSLIVADSSFFYTRIPAETGEKVLLVKHVQGYGAPNVDQAMVNILAPETQEYLIESFKARIDEGFDSLRVDLAFQLLKSNTQNYLSGLPAEMRTHWLQQIRTVEEPLVRIIREVRAYAWSKGQRIIRLNAEAYSEGDRETLLALGFDSTYYGNLFEDYAGIVFDGKPAHHLAASVEHVIRSPKKKKTIYGSNFDQTSLRRIGGPRKGFTMLLNLLSYLGIEVLWTLRDALGHFGDLAPIPGGVSQGRTDRHYHEFVTLRELQVRTNTDRLQQELRQGPLARSLAEITHFLPAPIPLADRKEDDVQTLDNQNTRQFITLAYRNNQGGWTVFVYNTQPDHETDMWIRQPKKADGEGLRTGYSAVDSFDQEIAAKAENDQLTGIHFERGEQYRIFNFGPKAASEVRAGTFGITGATGAVGTQLLRHLMQTEGTKQLQVLSRQQDDAKLGTADPRVKVTLGELTHFKALQEIVNASEVVYHLGGWSGLSKMDEAQALAVNSLSTAVLTELSKQAGKKLVLASTVHSYMLGTKKDGVVTEEDLRLPPETQKVVDDQYARIKRAAAKIINGDQREWAVILSDEPLPLPSALSSGAALYSVTKLIAERLAQDDPNAVILRFGNVYGPGDQTDRQVPKFIREMNAAEAVDEKTYIPGRQNSMIYVGDLVRALAAASQLSGAEQTQVINVVHPETVTQEALFQAIGAVTNSKARIAPMTAARMTELKLTVPPPINFETSRMQSQLGLSLNTLTPLDQGLEAARKWLLDLNAAERWAIPVRSEVRKAVERSVDNLARGEPVADAAAEFLSSLSQAGFNEAVSEIQKEARRPSVVKLAYETSLRSRGDEIEARFAASQPQFENLSETFLMDSIRAVRDSAHDALLSDASRELHFAVAFPLQMKGKIAEGLLSFAKMLQALSAEYPGRVKAEILLLADSQNLAGEVPQGYLKALRRTGVAKVLSSEDPQLAVETERFLRYHPNALVWGAFEDVLNPNRRIHLVRNQEVSLKTALPFAFLLSRKLAEARFLTADVLKKVPESMQGNGIAFNGSSLEVTRFALAMVIRMKAQQLLDMAA